MQEYLIIFLPAFLLGILHTAIPCEDKAIFFFWSFGIAKTPRKSIFLLAFYGFGLITSNLIIAVGTVLVSLVPRFILPGIIFDPLMVNFFGAFTSMITGLILLFFIIRHDYTPHSKYSNQIVKLDWEQKKTPFLFGILVGFAPCIFELIIYSQCLQFSLGYGFIEGILVVFYFSLGTFIGLFPLALAKYGSSYFVEIKASQKKKIYIVMISIIIFFNAVVILLSILKISVFPIQNI